MDLSLYGTVHLLYLGITLPLTVLILFLAKRYAKTERAQKIVLKSIAAMLFVWILLNRLSQVYRYSEVRWEQIIPDSFCGMTSLVLSLSVLFGKKDNVCFHFVWALGLVGSLITIFYPTFLDQSTSVFYLPTISGLLHHSLTLLMVSALLLFGQITITYKKWYCTLFGFTSYLTVGAFQMAVFDFNDSFHIVEPMIDGTFLTVWGVAPIYIGAYALVLLVIEVVRAKRKNKNSNPSA